jgi:hypothetical protein
LKKNHKCFKEVSKKKKPPAPPPPYNANQSGPNIVFGKKKYGERVNNFYKVEKINYFSIFDLRE